MSDLTPWTGHYDPGVPVHLAVSQPHAARLRVRIRPRDPKHPAILFKGSTACYGELDRLSDACAAAFTHIGISRGDRVALLLPNCPQFVIAELGAWKIGAIVAPLNPLYAEAEIGPARGGRTAILCLTRFYQRVKQAQPAQSGMSSRPTSSDFFPAVSSCSSRW
jgi:acyl-CoA synthetase (AMP-forming)/AMP-acid ligase II